VSRVFDFSDEFLDNENAVLVLDANFNFYKPRMEHDGSVFVEKCLVRKGKYVPTPLSDSSGNLTAKLSNSNAFLVKETNFSDVGGGLLTFERHYATIPKTWYQYEQVSYRTLWWGAINYRSSSGGGDSWDKTRTTSAQAYYYYFTKNELPTIPVPEGDFVGRDYLNDFTRVFTIAPESRVGSNWEGQAGGYGTTVAIAPDKITPYMGEIYEFVRYSFTF
jgi:hypothetical protein